MSFEIPFTNFYCDLPERFYKKAIPEPVPAPTLLAWNSELARELSLDSPKLTDEIKVEIFSGNSIPKSAKPIAMAYAGHQFGHFVTQLGDGRAILLGELQSKSANDKLCPQNYTR